MRKGILYCGIVMTFIASFIPFTYLNDMISAGVLLSFSLTDTGLLVLRRKPGREKHPTLLKWLLVVVNGGSFVVGVIATHFGDGWGGQLVCR